MRAALVLIVSLALLAGCGGDDSETTESVAAGADECASVEAPPARELEPGTEHAPPDEPFDAAMKATLTFDTSCGSFTITLDQGLAPNTVPSLAALATEGYFDETIFHRVVPGFVIQGGDPTQTGGGGPGYSTVDPPPSDAAYPQGTVAMAKSQVEAPGTSGSQFFIVTGDGSGLTPDYAIVGEVTDGLDTILRIDALGVGDGPPSQPVVVNSAVVGVS